MTRLLHTIPVGGTEPIHDCSEDCWCHPLRAPGDDVVVHHAKDCREARERNGGKLDPDAKWVIVGQKLP